MKKYVFSNKKGGVGKTTGTINLAGGLAELGYKVLVVDMEAQANCTFVFLRTRKPELSVYELLVDEENSLEIAKVIQKTNIPNIDIIPSHHIKMDGAERDFQNLIGQQLLLKHRLEELDQTAYDYVLIDSPPSVGILTINALVAADGVIIPVTPGVFALQGIEDVFRNVRLVKRKLNRNDLRIAGFLLNAVEHTNVAKDTHSQLIQHFNEAVFDTQIPKNVRLEEAHTRHGTIFQYAPKSTGALAYLSFTKELINYGNN